VRESCKRFKGKLALTPSPPLEHLSEGSVMGFVYTKRHFEGKLKADIVITKRASAQTADFKIVSTILF
jgi:hypothetical protein